MAEQPSKPNPETPAGATPGVAPGTPSGATQPKWSDVWQLPVLLLGVAMFVIGLGLVMMDRKEPDFHHDLDAISESIKAGNHEQAQKEWKALEPKLAHAPAQQRGRGLALAGDLIYLQQQANHWNMAANHQQVISAYMQAREFGQEIDDARLQRWAQSLLALGRENESLKIIDQIKGEGSAQVRYTVIRKMIDRRVANGSADPTAIAGLTKRFLDEVARDTNHSARRQQEIWAGTMRFRTMLGAGDAGSVIEALQRQIILFMEQGRDDDLAPLTILLAQAYQLTGNYPAAERYYQLTQQKLRDDQPGNEDLAAQVLIGLGQTALVYAEGRTEEQSIKLALEHFTKVQTDFLSSSVYLEALYGSADCEARLKMHDQAIEHYELAIKKLLETSNPPRNKVDLLVASIRQQHQSTSQAGDYRHAIQYLGLLEPLYKDSLPEQFLLAMAQTNWQLAQQIAEQLPSSRHSDDPSHGRQKMSAATDHDLPKLSPQSRQLIESAITYERAGDYFLKHADAVTIRDTEAYGNSLWRAGESFGRAQNWKKQIEALGQFTRLLPSDPRNVVCLSQLAKAYLSDNQPDVALDLYKRMNIEYPDHPETYASLVPMARCLTAIGQTQEAQRVLTHVVTDHPAIKPQSMEYRQALNELGVLLYRQREYEPAIERLSEAVDRFGDSAEGAMLRFTLADAYRLSSVQLQQAIAEEKNPSKKQPLMVERVRRLEQAQTFYNQFISEMDSRSLESFTDLERLQYRNAHFYRADCAYDLGRYEQAIALYDLSAKRFDSDPASLMALVQIVNSYAELGRIQEAKIANERARLQLRRIPESAFDDPGLPMNRQHWEDWLRWTSQLNLFGTQASAVNGAAPPSER